MCHESLIALYVVSASLEGLGVSVVFWEFVSGQRRAREIRSRRAPHRGTVFGGSAYTVTSSIEDAELARNPNSAQAQWIRRKRRAKQDREAAQVRGRLTDAASADKALTAELLDVIAGHTMRRLAGPVLLILGILVGTIANIANT